MDKSRNKGMSSPSHKLHQESVSNVYAVVDQSKKRRNTGKYSPSHQLHQESVSDVYAVVDQSKKRRNTGKYSPSHQLHQESVSDVYAVVDQSKKRRNTGKSSPHQLHLESVSDVYAVVDKSKKRRNTGKSSTSHKLHQDLSDAYAVVNTIKQPETDGVGEVLTAQEISTIDVSTPYALTPVYSQENQDKPATPSIFEKVHSYYKRDKNKIQKTGCRYSIFIASCLIFLVTAVIAAIVVALITISFTVNFQDDLQNFKQRLDQLEMDYHSNMRQQENTSLGFGEAISLLRTSMRALNKTFIQQVSSVANATSFLTESVTAANDYFQISINTLTDVLAKGIQAIHTFDSCADVFNFSIKLPSGMYSIRSGNSSINKYCFATTNTTIANSCNGIPGRWKRIAYLNTDENPVTCPDAFEVRNVTSSPPLCRRNNTSAGCSSVIYPSYGTSYSQVCGTVRVHPEGTPDGFSSHNSNQRQRNGQSVNQNYVDGVSLTYGDSSNRNHIWTYTAATTVRLDRRGCGICNNSKPIVPGTNFTCTNAYCSNDNSCFPNTLWGNDTKQCFGNETFYRQLSESTTDNIELRVCRDQDRDDEDILISFVELFVL